MERNSSGALRAPGAFGARDTSDHHIILSSCSLYITRVCSLAAVPRPSRAGASGATLRVLRTHCGVAESGFIGERRRLGRALYPPTDARFE